MTSVAADSTQLYVKWAQPTSSEGAVITKYKVDAVLVAGSVLTSSTDVLATARSHNITGLTAGAIYEIRLYAYNDQGYGAYQAATAVCDAHIELCTALVIPRALPGAPTGQHYSPALRRQAAAGPLESFVTNHFMRK